MTVSTAAGPQIDPALQPVLEASLAAEGSTLIGVEPAAQVRAALAQVWADAAPILLRPGPTQIRTEDHQVATTDGGQLLLRIYHPTQLVSRGVHLFFHGGGFWLGSVENSDSHCRWMAHLSGVTIASLDYRLAPEHPYPTPFTDCLLGALWLQDNAAQLDLDPTQVSVGGESAGGNAAAWVALALPGKATHPILALALSVPLVDWTNFDMVDDQRFTPAAPGMPLMSDYLFGADAPADVLAAASPLLQDLHQLPPTLVMTNYFDRLRNQGLDFARKLANNDVSVSTHHEPGLFHGSSGMTKLSPAARRYEAVYADFVRRVHTPTDPDTSS